MKAGSKLLHRMGIVVLVCAWLAQGQTAARAGTNFDEKYRPQFHFTAERGWHNDPNGLTFYDGEWHLFFQHNPNGTNWISELYWGHAVSADLVHWQQLPSTLPPTPISGGKVAGSWSGSGVVDLNNTAGFQTGKEKPIVLAWTAAGLGQCIAYSNDRGRTFTAYAGNPVIPMDPPRNDDWDRDPKVYFNDDLRQWTMAFSISGKGVVFNTSPDLKHWTRQRLFEGLFECPDYFPLPLDGNDAKRKWVIWDGSGKYFVGAFDGHEFVKENGPFLLDYGKNYYAAQTWSNAPAGRHVGIAWMRGGNYPGMPFNQQMTVPFELALRTTPVGVRLTKAPVKELEQLRYDTKQIKDQPLGRDNVLPDLQTDAADIEAEIEPGSASEIVVKVRGQRITWIPGLLKIGDAAAPLEMRDGRITLRVLLDRTSIEAFGNDGRASLSNCFVPPDDDRRIELYADHGTAHLVWLRASKMRSAWDKPE